MSESLQKEQDKKSGMVVLVGRSNVGKSTLLNALVGTKLAIVTAKPQTTRHLIHGVLNEPRGQAVFVDTPGYFTESRSPITGKLVEKIHQSLRGVNLILYVVDPSRQIGPEERYLLALLRKIDLPRMLVINKIDLHPRDLPFLEDYRALGEEIAPYNPKRGCMGLVQTIEISALKNKHLKSLINLIFDYLSVGAPLYPLDQISNVDQNFFIAELIREKIFNTMGDEVPYTATVQIEKVEDKKDILVIQAIVLTTDKRYRKMIIGQGARKIKEIGSTARRELELILNRKVYLDLQVEVDRDWEARFE